MSKIVRGERDFRQVSQNKIDEVAPNKSPYEHQRKYYAAMWATQPQKGMELGEKCRLRFILRAMNEITLKFNINRPLRIVDLGCGSGWITNSLSQYGNVVGVDLSPEVAKRSCPKLKFIQLDIMSGNIPEKFDVVVSSEVIEHLAREDQPAYIKKIFDILEKRGMLILTTPNRAKVEELLFAFPEKRQMLQPIENWLSPQSVIALLNPYFEINFMGSTMFYPISIKRNKYTSFLYNSIYDSLQFMDRFLKFGTGGLYLTVIAQAKGANQSFAPETRGVSKNWVSKEDLQRP